LLQRPAGLSLSGLKKLARKGFKGQAEALARSFPHGQFMPWGGFYTEVHQNPNEPFDKTADKIFLEMSK